MRLEKSNTNKKINLSLGKFSASLLREGAGRAILGMILITGIGETAEIASAQ